MRINHYRASLFYKIALTAIAVLGLVLHSGLLEGAPRSNMFVYYTNLSNLGCIILFAILSVYMANGKRMTISPLLVQFKGMLTMIILVTFIIYHFVLRPLLTDNLELLTGQLAEFGNFNSPGNIILHYIAPLMVFSDWLLFDEKGRFKWYSPPLWSLALVAYLLFTIIHANLSGVIEGTNSRFPYPFIDVDTLGASGVAKNSALILLAFIAIGYVYCLADHLLKRKTPG